LFVVLLPIDFADGFQHVLVGVAAWAEREHQQKTTSSTATAPNSR